MSLPLTCDITGGEFAKFGINQRQQFVVGFGIALLDSVEDARHVAQHLTITEGGEPKQVRIVARPTCYFKLSRPVQNDGALSQHPDGLSRQF